MTRHPRRPGGQLVVALLLLAGGFLSTNHRLEFGSKWPVRAVIVAGNIFLQWIAVGGTGSANPTWTELSRDEPFTSGPGSFGDDPDTEWCEYWIPAKATGNAHWRLPRVHKEFSSASGTLWTMILPAWFLALLVFALPDFASKVRRTLKSLHSDPERDALRRIWFLRMLGMSLATVAIWVLCTLFWVGGSTGNRDMFSIDRGVIELQFATKSTNWRFEGPARLTFAFNQWFWAEFSPEQTFSLPHTEYHAQSSMGVWTATVLPLWTVPAFLLGISALLSRKRSKKGHCRKCRYDLTGNLSGRCPECGEPTHQVANQTTTTSRE